MKIARAFGMTAALAALAVTSSPTTVRADDAGWYTGINAGQSRTQIDDARIADGLLGDGFATTTFSNDERHFGFKAYGGYAFNRYFALETGYFNLGRFGFTADTIPAGSLIGDIKLQGVNFDLVGSVPIGDKFSLFARGGVNYADAKDSFSGTGAVFVLDPSPRKWAANYKFGFGAEYDFTPSVGMRLEAERYRVDDAVGNKGDVDLYSAGLVFKFGRSEPPPPPPPPVVVAAAEPPPPTAAASAAPAAGPKAGELLGRLAL